MAVLQHIVNSTQSQAALDMLQEIREGRPIRPAPLVIVRDRGEPRDDGAMFLSDAEERSRPVPTADQDGFLDDTEFSDEEETMDPPPELTMPTDPMEDQEPLPEEEAEPSAVATEEGVETGPAEGEGGETPPPPGGEGGS